MITLKTPTAKYLISIPTQDTDPNNFTFDCNLPIGNVTFQFNWIDPQWYVFVTLPDGSIRWASIVPNVYNWLGYPDYYFLFTTSLDSVGWNDLASVKMYLWVL